jgi:hypothetical protein
VQSALRKLQILAALPAIQATQPIAAKNATAIQACESGSLFVTIATVIVAAAISDTTAITIQHMKNNSRRKAFISLRFRSDLDKAADGFRSVGRVGL